MKRIKTARLLAGLLCWLMSMQLFVGAVDYHDTGALPADRREALVLLYDLNIMRGSGGQFRPDDELTRQEMFRVMYSIMVGGEIEPPGAYYAEKLIDSGVYVDLGQIADWAMPYAGYNVFNKIFVGSDTGELDPLGSLTYVDCAATLLRALGMPEAELKGIQYAKNAIKYGQAAGILTGLSMKAIDDPVTRGDAALMIRNALNAYCIAGLSGGSLRYAEETGMQRYFRVGALSETVRSGIVTGRRSEGGRDWMVVSADEENLLYPFDAELYARYFGRPVQWNVRFDGGILTPMRLCEGTVEYTATIGQISPFSTQNGKLYVYFDGQRVDFPASALTGAPMFICDAAAGTVYQKSGVDNVINLIEYVRAEYGDRYGADTAVAVSYSDEYVVLRVQPKRYLSFDRSALTGGQYRIDDVRYTAEGPFGALPDGAVISVLCDMAGKRLTLLSVLQPVTVDSGALRAETDADGAICFALNGVPVENRTYLFDSVEDAALAEQYSNAAKRGMTKYVLADGESLVAAGYYADFRLPYTEQPAYMLVERLEPIHIGGIAYTALYGQINGAYGCELIDADFGVPLSGGRLLRLTTDTNTRGETVVRPYTVAETASGETDGVGIGSVEEAIYPEGESRELVVAGKTLALTADCAVVCADADGSTGGYRLADLLVAGGKGYGESAPYSYRAVYGRDGAGDVCWLMLVRTPV